MPRYMRFSFASSGVRRNFRFSTGFLQVCTLFVFLFPGCFAELLRKMTLGEFLEKLRPSLAKIRPSRLKLRPFPHKLSLDNYSLENYGRQSKTPVIPGKPAESRPMPSKVSKTGGQLLVLAFQPSERKGFVFFLPPALTRAQYVGANRHANCAGWGTATRVWCFGAASRCGDSTPKTQASLPWTNTALKNNGRAQKLRPNLEKPGFSGQNKAELFQVPGGFSGTCIFTKEVNH